ncbi:MAG: PilZ domain-containing protein [Candidatus Saelkia tenebricola]|nr:PilZ domain-containing protein [Candidatus Saelkia tenebricola]
MKNIRIYFIVFFLFLISLLGFPQTFSVYFALILLGFCLGALWFYKKPDSLSLKTIRYLRIIIAMFFIYSLLVLFIRSNITVFCIALIAILPYLIFWVKDRKIPKLPSSSEEDRRALRTDLCFDIELTSIEDNSFCCRGITKDFSTTGMKVFMSQKLEKGSRFYFRMYLPEENWPLTGEVDVVWSKVVKSGFEHGVIFTKISEQNRGKLALKQGFSLLE